MYSRVLLPDPEGPTMKAQEPCGDPEADAAQSLDLLVSARVCLAHVVGIDHERLRERRRVRAARRFDCGLIGPPAGWHPSA